MAALITGAVADRKNQRLFRIEIDSSTLIAENRTAGTQEGGKGGEEILEFSELPENLTLNKSAYWNNEQIPGRGEPWKNYAATSPTRINFTAKLVAMGGTNDRKGLLDIAGTGLGLAGRFISPTQPFLGIAGNAISAAADPGSVIANFLGIEPDDKIPITFDEVHRKIAFLESLLHPQIDNLGRSFPPPSVFLCYGENFRRRGVIMDVSFVYKGPWEINTLMCMQVECNIVFEEANAAPKSHNQVKNRELGDLGQPGADFSADKFRVAAQDFARSFFGI